MTEAALQQQLDSIATKLDSQGKQINGIYIAVHGDSELGATGLMLRVKHLEDEVRRRKEELEEETKVRERALKQEKEARQKEVAELRNRLDAWQNRALGALFASGLSGGGLIYALLKIFAGV